VRSNSLTPTDYLVYPTVSGPVPSETSLRVCPPASVQVCERQHSGSSDGHGLNIRTLQVIGANSGTTTSSTYAIAARAVQHISFQAGSNTTTTGAIRVTPQIEAAPSAVCIFSFVSNGVGVCAALQSSYSPWRTPEGYLVCESNIERRIPSPVGHARRKVICGRSVSVTLSTLSLAPLETDQTGSLLNRRNNQLSLDRTCR